MRALALRIRTVFGRMRGMRLFCALFAVTLVSVAAEVSLGAKSRLRVGTLEEGRAVLTKRDDFVERLSGFDRQARLKRDRPVSEEEFLRFVATNVMEFKREESSRVEASLERLKAKIDPLRLAWPETILLIKTTGKEEGEAAYTRGNAVVIPAGKLRAERAQSMDDLICHELFHVLSRHNATLKERLYEAIGFGKCEELKFPAGLQRITNPDAPKNDHWIGVKLEGKEFAAIPILYAESNDAKKGGEFFNYLQFKLLLGRLSGRGAVRYDDAKPKLVEVSEVDGFFEGIGKNTEYIIHPEEILADNFVLLVNGKTDVKSPEVLRKMRGVLEAGKK
jgi:hypothetical protein